MNIKIPIREVKQIIRETPDDLRGKAFGTLDNYRDFEYIGWAKKKNANWLYFVYVINRKNKYKDLTFIATIGNIIQ